MASKAQKHQATLTIEPRTFVFNINFANRNRSIRVTLQGNDNSNVEYSHTHATSPALHRKVCHNESMSYNWFLDSPFLMFAFTVRVKSGYCGQTTKTVDMCFIFFDKIRSSTLVVLETFNS